MSEALSKLFKLLPEIHKYMDSPEGQQLRADRPEIQEAYTKMQLGLIKIRKFLEDVKGGNNVGI